MSFEAFIAEAYVQLVATDLKCYTQALRSETSYCYGDRVTLNLHTVLCCALYTACVDASRTVFWDCSVLR